MAKRRRNYLNIVKDYYQLRLLKALPSVDGSSKMVRIAWIVAPAPAFKPATAWSDPADSCMSSFSVQFIVLPITRLKTSLLPIGLASRFWYREISLHVVSESIKWESTKVDANVLANKAICSLKLFASALNFLLNSIWRKWSELLLSRFSFLLELLSLLPAFAFCLLNHLPSHWINILGLYANLQVIYQQVLLVCFASRIFQLICVFSFLQDWPNLQIQEMLCFPILRPV